MAVLQTSLNKQFLLSFVLFFFCQPSCKSFRKTRYPACTVCTDSLWVLHGTCRYMNLAAKWHKLGSGRSEQVVTTYSTAVNTTSSPELPDRYFADVVSLPQVQSPNNGFTAQFWLCVCYQTCKIAHAHKWIHSVQYMLGWWVQANLELRLRKKHS